MGTRVGVEVFWGQEQGRRGERGSPPFVLTGHGDIQGNLYNQPSQQKFQGIECGELVSLVIVRIVQIFILVVIHHRHVPQCVIRHVAVV